MVACVPQLKGRDHQLAASVSLAYNIGTSGFCKSTVAKRFRAGNFKGACDRFYAWRFAGAREVKGLVRPRFSRQGPTSRREDSRNGVILQAEQVSD